MDLVGCLTLIQKKEYRRQYLAKFTTNNTTWQKRHQSAKVPSEDNLDTQPPPQLHSPFWMARRTFPPILMKLPRSCLWRLQRFAPLSLPTQSPGLFCKNIGNSVRKRLRRIHPHPSPVFTLATILWAQTVTTSPNSTPCRSHLP